LWQELSTSNPHQVALIDEQLYDGLNITFTFAEADMKHIVDRASRIYQSLANLSWTSVNAQRGISAVLGADAPLDELRYIYVHSDSAGMVALQGPKLLFKLLQDGTMKHPVTETTNTPFGLSNEMYCH
jgi:long-chain acyl-CoA synthetase